MTEPGEVSRLTQDQGKTSLRTLADMVPLTPYNEEFYIQRVNDGDLVFAGKSHTSPLTYFAECDFQSFDSLLSRITPGITEELFTGQEKFADVLPGQTDDFRRTVHACWRAARAAKHILKNPTMKNAAAVGAGDENYRVPGEKYCAKPLSASVGDATCLDYALVAHRALEKMGKPSAVVIGARADPVTRSIEEHTFLVLDSGNLVFDPTLTVHQDKCWPPWVLEPESPLTVDTLQNLAADGSFGHKISCTDIFSGATLLYGSGTGWTLD